MRKGAVRVFDQNRFVRLGIKSVMKLDRARAFRVVMGTVVGLRRPGVAQIGKDRPIAVGVPHVDDRQRDAAPGGDQFDFRDLANRRWTGDLDPERRVLSWTLSENGAPRAWWMRRDDWAILSDRERGVQLRWREVLRENLDREPPRLAAPAGYREVPCAEQEVPDLESEPSLP